MAQLAAVPLLITGAIIVIAAFIMRAITSQLDKYLGSQLSSMKSSTEETPLVGGLFGFILSSVFRIVMATMIIGIALLQINTMIIFMKANTIETPDGTVGCWPAGMLKCKSLDVDGKNIDMALDVSDDISKVYVIGDYPAYFETPHVFVEKGGMFEKTASPRTMLCPMKSWEYKNKELTVQLECQKSVKEQLTQHGADSLVVNWKVEISEPPQPPLMDGVKDMFLMILGDVPTYAKYYEGKCRSLNGNERVCEVIVGGRLQYGEFLSKIPTYQ